MARLLQVASAVVEEPDYSAPTPLLEELGVASLISSQYYELRLAADAPQLDYLVAFKRERALRLRRVIAERIAQDAGYQSEGWALIQRLLYDWTSGGTLTQRRTPSIWFELDDYAQQPRGAVPSLSVCLAPGYRADHALTAGSHEDAAHAADVLRVLGASPEVLSSLNTTFERLPQGARWIHLSYMLGRQRRATKLYGVMPRQELLPFLARVGWAGDVVAIAAGLDELYPTAILGPELYLDLNLDDFRDPERCSLGLAVAQQHLLHATNADPTRRDILSVWLARGLCDPQKALMTQAWPGSADPRRQHVLQRDERYLDLKLVWRSGSDWLAKAYMGRELKRGWG